MMILMHQSERYGYLCANGVPVPPASIARRIGIDLEQYTSLLSELDSVGVPARSTEGIIYSKRMVEDASRRAEWRKRQKNHRYTDVTVKSRDSHAVLLTSSSTTKKRKKQTPAPDGARDSFFDTFWDNYPRKVGKPAARKAFMATRELPEKILDGLYGWVHSWRDGRIEERFIPHPATWLNQRRWEDEPPDLTTEAQREARVGSYREDALRFDELDGARKSPGTHVTEPMQYPDAVKELAKRSERL